MGKFRYLEIESRVVNQNHHIGLPLLYVLFAERNIAEKLARLHEHFHKADYRSLLVMLHKASRIVLLASAEDFVHKVATPESDFRLRVFRIYAFHQI